MIRIFIGLFIVWGVAGGVDTMPEDASWSYIGAMISLVIVGLFLMLSGLKKIQR